MAGNVARWMGRLEVQGHTPNNFPEFKKLFINYYTPLDDKNVARDKLRELWQCGSKQEYISVFNSIVVVLLKLGREDSVHVFVYGLKP